MENKVLEIAENTYVGKVKDILELLASWAGDMITEVYYSNNDSETLSDAHINDTSNILNKMYEILGHCEEHNYNSNKLIAVDLGFDSEGINWLRTLKEESEW